MSVSIRSERFTVAARDPSRAWFWFLVCCFGIICGFRFFLIQRFGAPVAWGDDLDGIGHRILAPLHAGTFTWPLLFQAHNGDHVITATRLWEMLWFTLNGDWDPQLGTIVKAPIFAAAMTIFVHLFTRGLERWRFAAAALLTALIAFPFNYHNLLWSFQSQWDFFFLIAALGWLALLNGRPVLALACAAVAPFTLGAAPVLAVSFVPFFFLSALDRSWSWRRAAVCTAVAGGLAAFGMSLSTPEAMPHTGTLAAKGAMLAKLCAWPFSNLLSAIERLPESANLIPAPLLRFPSAENSWMLGLAAHIDRFPVLEAVINTLTAIVILAPIATVAWLVLRKRIAFAVARGPLAVSTFAALMIGATAVARTDQPTIAMRFLDHVSLAGFASIVAAFILVAWNRRARSWIAVWSVVLGLGYLAAAGATLSQMVNRRKPQVALEILQRYYAAPAPGGVLVTHHEVMLEDGAFRNFIVSDNPTEFLRMLDDPTLRAVLPRAITAPEQPRGWAARAALAVARFGLLIVFVAAAGALAIVTRTRRAKSYVSPVIVPVRPA